MLTTFTRKAGNACMLITMLCYYGKLQAQTDTIGRQPYSIIKINFEKHRLEPFYLPFDVPFVLAAPAPANSGIDSIVINYYSPGKKCIVKKSIHLVRDIFSTDTLYGNVDAPLRPVTPYTFEFLVYRGITPKEDTELTFLVKPVLVKDLTTIYNDCKGPGDLKKLLMGALPANGDLDALTYDLKAILEEYYNKKRISNKDSIEKLVTKASVALFIQANYLEAMEEKRHSANFVGSKISSVEKEFCNQNVANQPSNLQNWPLLKVLYDSSEKFKIDGATKSFIQRIRDQDTLKKLIYARPDIFNLIADHWWDTKGPNNNENFVASEIKEFVNASQDFTKNCESLASLLTTLTNGPLLDTLRRLDRACDAEISTFNKTFLTKIQATQVLIKSYYDKSNVLDTLLANKTYHFNAEFKLNFNDPTVGLTSADFVTRGEWYIVADLGFAYISSYPSGQVRPYIGVNFNIFPINRQANYSLFKRSKLGYSFIGTFVRNLSVTVGVTVFNSFGSKDHYTDLFGTTGSPLSGLALRISDGIRMSGGVCWVNRKDNNPLSRKTYFTGLGYGALSIDLDLKKWLRGFGSIFWK